jgi:hypothetical protein
LKCAATRLMVILNGVNFYQFTKTLVKALTGH